ncbi:MAG TPA: hypothetical protein VFJ82_02965 [Longimicrobium sp.]|nr:hypothetical protein [Longimicrobium sp.]
MTENRNTVRDAVDFDGSFAEQLGAAVREKLAAVRALVSGPVLEAAVGRVVEAAAARLDTPLADLLTGAWARYPEIQELTDAVRHPSDQETLAELAEHRFGWSYRPEIEVVINESTSIPVPLGMEVGVTVLGGVLVVQGGRFRELRAGKLSLGVAVAVAGKEVAKRAKGVELPAVLRFGEAGVAIREPVPAVKIAPAHPDAVAASS